MKGVIFWVIKVCNPLKINKRFGGKCRLHPQGQRKAKQEISVKQVASKTSDEGDIFLRNID
jgi:hypothetical protein